MLLPRVKPLLLSGAALLLAVVAGCATLSSPVSGAGTAGPVAAGNEPPATFSTTVANLPGEDLAGPCQYQLSVANPGAPVRGVLTVYDRGDSDLLYQDAGVRAMAAGLDFATLFAFQCDAASYDDLQVDAFAGPGRALFAALDQFSASTGHAELARDNVVLYGFSAAGVLAATTANYKPSRVLGAIGYAAASAHLQIDRVTASAAALRIPFLMLSSDEDVDAGTAHDGNFFARGWGQGAPWQWGVQKGVGHCCTLTTQPMVLAWVPAIVGLRQAEDGTVLEVASGSGELASFTCTPNGTWDVTGDEDCTFTASAVLPPGRGGADGWLPDGGSAAAWLKWVSP